MEYEGLYVYPPLEAIGLGFQIPTLYIFSINRNTIFQDSIYIIYVAQTFADIVGLISFVYWSILERLYDRVSYDSWMLAYKWMYFISAGMGWKPTLFLSVLAAGYRFMVVIRPLWYFQTKADHRFKKAVKGLVVSGYLIFVITCVPFVTPYVVPGDDTYVGSNDTLSMIMGYYDYFSDLSLVCLSGLIYFALGLALHFRKFFSEAGSSSLSPGVKKFEKRMLIFCFMSWLFTAVNMFTETIILMLDIYLPALLLLLLSFFVNPILHWCINSQFRKATLEIFCRRFKKKRTAVISDINNNPASKF